MLIVVRLTRADRRRIGGGWLKSVTLKSYRVVQKSLTDMLVFVHWHGDQDSLLLWPALCESTDVADDVVVDVACGRRPVRTGRHKHIWTRLGLLPKGGACRSYRAQERGV